MTDGWWKVPRVWDGGDCWIIGGGPSMLDQFGVPQSARDAVKNEEVDVSEYGIYMKPLLHDKHIIAVNAAYKLGDWIDMMFFGDMKFFKQFRRDLADFKGLKITCTAAMHHRGINIKVIKRLPGKKVMGLSDNPNYICWNANSGGAAINVAAHTGVKRIFLLGFDMQSGNQGHHWHQLYDKKNNPPYATHRLCFPSIAKDAKRMGVEIINVSPESSIMDFPKKKLQDVI